MIYGCQIWGQQKTIVNKIERLQENVIRIINFRPYGTPSNDSFKSNNILKLSDYISLQNLLFVKNVWYMIYLQYFIIIMQNLIQFTIT